MAFIMKGCKNCYKDKELVVCWDCYWERVCAAISAGDKSTIADMVRWNLQDNLDSSLEPIILRLENIEKYFKIKLPKGWKK
jgi:hypothetical protein